MSTTDPRGDLDRSPLAVPDDATLDDVVLDDAIRDAVAYNPRAEWGDPDWREPASDAEAAARTAYLDSQPRSPETQAWLDQLAETLRNEPESVRAGIEMEHARHTHDPGEVADAAARYRAAVTRDIANGLLPREAAEDELGNDEPPDDEIEEDQL